MVVTDNMCLAYKKRGFNPLFPNFPCHASLLTAHTRQVVMKYVATKFTKLYPKAQSLYHVTTALSRIPENPHFRWMEHLYRFMWWYHVTNQVLYDPSLHQYEPMYIGPTYEHRSPSGSDGIFSYESKARLVQMPSGKMKFVKIQSSENIRENTDGVFCALHLKALPIYDEPLSFPNVQNPKFKISTKVCDKGHHIQVFHKCANDEHKEAAHIDDRGKGISPTGLSLFECVDKLSVIHFTKVCDGVYDCHDQSDEQSCFLAEEVIADRSIYICRSSITSAQVQ